MTNTPNVHLTHVIAELKRESAIHGVGIWKRVAEDLEKPTRRRAIVNLSRITRFTRQHDTIIVPGKVLGAGELPHSITIAAWDFSQSARHTIEQAKGTCMNILDLVKKEPKGKNVKIIGS